MAAARLSVCVFIKMSRHARCEQRHMRLTLMSLRPQILSVAMPEANVPARLVEDAPKIPRHYESGCRQRYHTHAFGSPIVVQHLGSACKPERNPKRRVEPHLLQNLPQACGHGNCAIQAHSSSPGRVQCRDLRARCSHSPHKAKPLTSHPDATNWCRRVLSMR